MKQKIGKILKIVLIALFGIAIIAMIWVWKDNGATLFNFGESGSTSRREQQGERLFDSKKIPFVKEEIRFSIDVLEDGLKNMGTLVTHEYFFSMIETYEKTVTALGIPSTAKVSYSYDGTVLAGVDFKEVFVEKNDDEMLLKIYIPGSFIQTTTIDFDSFKLFEEKNGLWSKIKAEDINKSLVELEKKAREQAVEKGILKNADKNAETIIGQFVASMPGTEDYKVIILHK